MIKFHVVVVVVVVVGEEDFDGINFFKSLNWVTPHSEIIGRLYNTSFSDMASPV